MGVFYSSPSRVVPMSEKEPGMTVLQSDEVVFIIDKNYERRGTIVKNIHSDDGCDEIYTGLSITEIVNYALKMRPYDMKNRDCFAICVEFCVTSRSGECKHLSVIREIEKLPVRVSFELVIESMTRQPEIVFPENTCELKIWLLKHCRHVYVLRKNSLPPKIANLFVGGIIIEPGFFSSLPSSLIKIHFMTFRGYDFYFCLKGLPKHIKEVTITMPRMQPIEPFITRVLAKTIDPHPRMNLKLVEFV